MAVRVGQDPDKGINRPSRGTGLAKPRVSVWTAAKPLSNSSAEAAGATVAATGGEVHVAWYDDRDIYYRRSTDGGDGWVAQRRISGSAPDAFHPKIAVAGPSVHIVWAKNSLDKRDVYYRRSRDGGHNWDPVRRLTTNGINVGPPAHGLD